MAYFKKLRIISSIVVTLLIIITFSGNIAYAAGESAPRNWDELTVGGMLKEGATLTSYAVILDAHTGKVLYEENSNIQKYPASITKIMTCLLVIESADLDEYVQITDLNITDDKAKIIGLQKGELITVRDLLYSLMLESGNDAAVALAMHIGGSLQGFANMMNARAAEIGMIGTNYVNPHGLHDEAQYTTAMDMALLAYVAMKNPTFKEIVGTYMHLPPTTNIHGEDLAAWNEDVWENLNSLVSQRASEEYAFDDSNGKAVGIKTGYTSAAQATLVGAAQSKDGTQEVITVVLDGSLSGRWSDTITMFMYAFDFFDTIDLSELLITDEKLSVHVENAISNESNENLELTLVPTEKTYITDKTEYIQAILSNPDRFTSTQNIDQSLVAPIEKGQEVGTVDYYLDGKETPVLTCKVIAAHDVKAVPDATPTPVATLNAQIPTPIPNNQGSDFFDKDLIVIVLGAVGVLIVIIIIVMISRSAKRKRHYANSRNSRSSSSRYNEGTRRGRGRRR